MVQQLSVLIIASPGQLRDGLQTLLRAVPAVGKVVHAHDNASAVEMDALYCPALIVLDFDTAHQERLAVLQQCKARCKAARSLVLVDTEQQHLACATAGADMVVVKGIHATKLLALIESVLEQSVQ